MKRLVALGIVAVLLLPATGCGGPDTLMREFIANLNAYADTLEKRESRDKQNAALERIKATAEKLDKSKVSADEREKLLAKYDEEIKKAKVRIEAAYKELVAEGGTADLPNIFGVLAKPK